jgi:hypothetical protein
MDVWPRRLCCRVQSCRSPLSAAGRYRATHVSLLCALSAHRAPVTQFTIDLVSVFPFWVLTLDYADPFGEDPFGGGADDDGDVSSANAPRLMRIIKLARMYGARPLQR